LCRQIYGVDREALALGDWLALIDPEDQERLAEVAARLERGEEVKRLQYRIRPANDPRALHWVEVWSRPVRDEADGGARLIGVVQDITARKAVEAELSEHRARLEAQLRIDPLTGVANRRALDEAASFQLALAIRGASPLALLMIDVDHFKHYNDHYGHVAGDECLKAVAAALQARVGRAGELVARYGGEEFAVLLPLSDGRAALALAQRMCTSVRRLQIPHAASTTASCVTVSVGVAWLRPQTVAVEYARTHHAVAEGATAWPLMQQLFEQADTALYEAKRQGRNRALLNDMTTDVAT
jgi:diguanylate cyclase (GGDEF)-like protein/PAS domain S-box-containing protein